MEQLLPWNGGWRKEYAVVAKELGYICQWGSAGSLAFFRAKDGFFLASEKPEGKAFSMAQLVKQAEKDGAERIREKERKGREAEERFDEYCSRSAAGEPLRMIWKARREKRESEGLPSSPLSKSFLISAALLGASAWKLGGVGGFGGGRRFGR